MIKCLSKYIIAGITREDPVNFGGRCWISSESEESEIGDSEEVENGGGKSKHVGGMKKRSNCGQRFRGKSEIKNTREYILIQVS